MARLFDRQLGPGFIEAVPAEPGVYRVYASDGALVYVGKAKSLRRRLAQYRRASAKKRHRKMRAIIKSAARIEWEVTASALDAELLEARLIAAHRPRWNIAGAFSFLYPMLGTALGPRGELVLAYATDAAAETTGVRWFGAFRSRDLVRDGFFALVRLLALVGHLDPARRRASGDFVVVRSIRALPAELSAELPAFLEGRSRALLAKLAVALLDRPTARRRAAEVQDDLDAAARFFRREAAALRRAKALAGHDGDLVPQSERDSLFIRSRAAASARRAGRAQPSRSSTSSTARA